MSKNLNIGKTRSYYDEESYLEPADKQATTVHVNEKDEQWSGLLDHEGKPLYRPKTKMGFDLGN